MMLTLKCQEIEKELKLNEVMALLTGLPGPAKEEKPADSGRLADVPVLLFSGSSCPYLLPQDGFFNDHIKKVQTQLTKSTL